MVPVQKFDLLGLYPKTLSGMTPNEIVLSAAITVFFVYGLIAAVQLLFSSPSMFIINFLSTGLTIGGVYLILSAVHDRALNEELRKEKKKLLANQRHVNTRLRVMKTKDSIHPPREDTLFGTHR